MFCTRISFKTLLWKSNISYFLKSKKCYFNI
nr:MAG TPA: hypothetical protein [Caudoviricetes sp.]